MALTSAATAVAAPAQSEGTGPLVLRLPGGTRALALGDAFVGGRGSEMVFYNPAQLSVVAGITASAERYGSASTLATLSSAMGVGGPWAVGVGIQYLDYATSSSVFPADPGDLTTEGPVPATSLSATVAAAGAFKGVRLGLAAKYVEERLPSDRDGAAAFDVGAAKDVGSFTVGLAAQHLGEHLNVDSSRLSLPTRVTLGAMSRRSLSIGSFFDLGVSLAVSVARGGEVLPAGGLELVYEPVDGWQFAVRAGARRVENAGAEPPDPLTGGLGFSLDRFSVDYAYESFSGSGGGHRVGVRVR